MKKQTTAVFVADDSTLRAPRPGDEAFDLYAVEVLLQSLIVLGRRLRPVVLLRTNDVNDAVLRPASRQLTCRKSRGP
ncbi:MAG: hypothetical protein KDA52_05905 [Planctomycetaceae bacterium]|nr:hypothetical protein [Planctomycetaceae bacterium]